MQVKLIGSPGYGRFSSFEQLYDIEFDMSAQDNLALPAGSGADLLFARPPTTATAEAPVSASVTAEPALTTGESGQNAEPTG
jgi:hypothetical protein